ncbi:hypothetical protein WR25_17585 [Diploscapter pachys]|uniref:Uncharacterized protein n=1 Tax=Diploscapter pachys TaxID=2018661 RepID=A0A2A2J2I1_9BILA|nr:hypothetical protein WR25_17585 [Diploscapter pachys]
MYYLFPFNLESNDTKHDIDLHEAVVVVVLVDVDVDVLVDVDVDVLVDVDVDVLVDVDVDVLVDVDVDVLVDVDVGVLVDVDVDVLVDVDVGVLVDEDNVEVRVLKSMADVVSVVSITWCCSKARINNGEQNVEQKEADS